METWRAFHSQDGPSGSRNALGQILFPSNVATRSTRSEAARVVSPHLPYAAKNLMDNGIAMWNKFPALREASTKRMASNLTNHLSVSMLNGQPIVLPVDKMIGCALKSTEDALKSAPLKAHIAKKTKFDVVVVSAFLANDAGYYLAHYFESDLVLYFTGQTSMSWMDHAMGMSPSPSFVPFTLFSFQHPMSFLQRVGNTVAVFIFEHVMRAGNLFHMAIPLSTGVLAA
eukprot:snap_masked-scaffold1486_size38793-processed-gene-0.2 protein:Tk01002 transcript:snap_masked-scaffold1486_size38793-processed-gene-0.2-mRNA-1 annotation:"udp-glucuronosyltransferase 2b30-like"